MTRRTSVSAYREIEANGLLSKRRLEVYECLFKDGPLTGAQVAVKIRRPNQVSETVRNRITELVKLGVAYEVKEVDCPVTHRQVILFDVTERLPKDYEKPKTKAQIIKELETRLIDSEAVILGNMTSGDYKRKYIERYKP